MLWLHVYWLTWSLVFPIFYGCKDEEKILYCYDTHFILWDDKIWSLDFISKFWNSHCASVYYIYYLLLLAVCLCATVDLVTRWNYLSWLEKFIVFSNCPRNLWFLDRFSWGDLRTPGKLSSTSALHQECHTATPSHTFAQRGGSLRRQEEGGTAGASRSKWPQPCESMPFCSYQLNITVLVCLDVRISCYYLISDQSNFAPIICAVGLVVSPSRRYSHIFMGGNCVKVYLAFLHCSSMFAWQLYCRNLFI